MFSSRGKQGKNKSPGGFPVTRASGGEDDFEQVPMSAVDLILENFNVFQTQMQETMTRMETRLAAVETSPSRGGGYLTPQEDESEKLGEQLRSSLNTDIPKKKTAGNNNGGKKSEPVEKSPSTPQDNAQKAKVLTKKEKHEANHRKSIANLEKARQATVEPAVKVVAATEERRMVIQQLENFTFKLSMGSNKSELSAKNYDDFYAEVRKYESKHKTKIIAGAYLDNEVIEFLIRKNNLAKDSGLTALTDLEKEVEIFNLDLTQLDKLVKIALAPTTLVELEAQLKKYLSNGLVISNPEKSPPRIYQFEEFYQEINKYIKIFNSRLTLMSGSNHILPLKAKKDTEGVDGSLNIFLKYLPSNYCTYLRQFMKEVPPDDDDIVQFVERFKKAHHTYGYEVYNQCKPLAIALVKDYPSGSAPARTPAAILTNKSTYPRSTARPQISRLHSLPDQQELDIDDWDQLAPNDPDSKDQSLLEEDDSEDVLEEQLNALVSPQKTLYDPGTPAKKASTGRGCFNVVIFGACNYEGKGCRNLHDTPSVKLSAELMYETAGKFLGKKST